MSAPPGRRRTSPLRLRRGPNRSGQEPSWQAAKPALIASALARATARPSGNWYVVGPAGSIASRGRPCGRLVGGREVVLWRDGAGTLRAGSGVCPHLGAPLKDGLVVGGTLVCHWHGLALDGVRSAGWERYPVHEDGVLAWVRLDAVGGEEPTQRPAVPRRPAPEGTVSAVYTGLGRCEPQDVVANRLDPWHGSWLHPYAFTDLRVVAVPDAAGDQDDGFVVDVSFRVAGRLVVPVRAVFTAPGPRTVVMRIARGEGAGSVVETHATALTAPFAPAPRTAVVEAVVAASGRRGFAVARALAPVLRPVMRRTAGRLWRDDLAYAERRWALRSTGRFPG
ncbi:DUF5914 domain-containing protein [Streptomyces sp. NRRL S-350]|uniref:DUF5914 domain-containing protein n=1 Tax=Streptomyces sp. NRRL S-350 TaxID=1463902 RepID=UPI0004BEAA47|nr:DUF5914 domain-containing protein [Streptomyces sp. NRRL S-350]